MTKCQTCMRARKRNCNIFSLQLHVTKIQLQLFDFVGVKLYSLETHKGVKTGSMHLLLFGVKGIRIHVLAPLNTVRQIPCHFNQGHIVISIRTSNPSLTLCSVKLPYFLIIRGSSFACFIYFLACMG